MLVSALVYQTSGAVCAGTDVAEGVACVVVVVHKMSLVKSFTWLWAEWFHTHFAFVLLFCGRSVTAVIACASGPGWCGELTNIRPVALNTQTDQPAVCYKRNIVEADTAYR